MLLPSGGPLAQLDKYMKITLKQTMSIPVNTPDPVVCVLSGILPMEAQIHIKTLIMYNSIYFYKMTVWLKKWHIENCP